VLVTVNPAYRPGELRHVLGQSRSAGVFLMSEYRGNPMRAALDEVRPRLGELREVVFFDDGWDAFLAGADAARALPEVAPDDPVMIQYTSGTTGFPKGAVLLHHAVCDNARLCAQRLTLGAGEAWLNPMPLFHGGGSVLGVLGTLWQRATNIPVLAFEPGLVLELLEAERAAVMSGVPTMLLALLEHPDLDRRDLSALRVVLSGGSTVPVELVRRMESGLGVDFTIVYGQTEASIVLTQTAPSDTVVDKGETIGTPLPHIELKIAEPQTGEPVPIGEQGEICARGFTLMAGYFELPDQTAATIDADGWLHSGDLGTMDDRGYVRIVGRLKDMIIRGGENIYPREIEELLYAHPAVADVAVLGVSDARWGETVAAVIRPAAGDAPSEDELFRYCREHLAAYKTPRVWRFVDEMPLTASGKIQKFRLRELLEADRV
jgi:fatty-acyl-CoA synthase